ncbi:MAG: hypothetical protein OEO79_01520 [Gemmatimonadota bacterium]|nr:hypothetical protein [Gemmatimonadota bacterium]MDH3422615.1 hypothetical protein [Gemmatimonadota bacterium]
MTKHLVHERWKAPRVTAALAALTISLTACGDDPFAFRWSDAPDTAQIYSLARPELNIESGFSFADGRAIAIELPSATGFWDAALDTQGGSLVLLPPGALGITSRARIAVLPATAYGDVVEAPADTLLYEADDPVPVVAGTIYVIRTNLRPGSFNSTCSYYGKMEPLVIDVPNGILTFRYITSPICNSRDLIPPE